MCCIDSVGGSDPDQTSCEVAVAPSGLSTIDSLAIQAALDGPEQVVCLEGGTFVLQFGVVVPAGKLLKGANSTLQRQPQFSTTTDTPLVSGVTTVFVVAAVGTLKVGDDVGFDGGAGNVSAQTSRVTSIVGLSVTVSPAVTITDPGPGTSVFTTSYLVALRDDSIVQGLTFDGNEPNNAIGRWQTTGSVLFGDNIGVATAHRAVCRDCQVLNEAGEGMLLGSQDTLVDHFVVDAANGNGIHLGSAVRFSIRDCHFANCNQDVSVGHADGCISCSLSNTDGILEGCSFRDSPLAGIGGLQNTVNHDWKIVGCHFENLVTNAIRAVMAVDAAFDDLLIANNTFEACGPVDIQEVLPSTTVPRRTVVQGNIFQNTRLRCQGLFGATIVGNTMRHDDNVNIGIQCSACQNTRVAGNVVEDGSIGISFDGATTHTLAIEGNTIINAHDQGISLQETPAGPVSVVENQIRMTDVLAATAYGILLVGAADGTNMLIEGNQVHADGGSARTYNGISVAGDSGRASVLNNRVRNVNATGATRGIWIGSTSIAKGNVVQGDGGNCLEQAGIGACVMHGNTCIRGAAANYAIALGGAGSLARVVNNQVQGNINDNSGGTAVVRDNDALP